MTREAHAHALRMAVAEAASTLRSHAWSAGTDFDLDSAREEQAMTTLRARLDALAAFAGMDDEAAELEFDGAPEQQWQVTAPLGVER